MKSRPFLFGILTALCIAVVFFNTIFHGQPISRFSLIHQLDVLYNPKLLGASLSVSQDPSACLQSIPREFFVAKSIRCFQSPIWNPLSGCGQPLIADPANTIWNPIDNLFPPTNQDLYNLGIVLKIVLGGIFAFLLFMRSGAAPWAACTAALGFSLCPRVLRGVELATNFEVLPLLFLLFKHFPINANLARLCVLSLGIGLCYISLHPEVFFVGVCTASLLRLTEQARSREQENKSISISPFIALGKLGMLSIFWIAPLFFSFLEYLQVAHSYKFSGSSIEYIPLSQLVAFLFLPKISGSLFIGAITTIGLFCGIAKTHEKSRATLVMIALLVIYACRPQPLDVILAKPPFSYLLPEYLLGTIMMLTCSVCSVGLTELNIVSDRLARRLTKAFGSLALACAPLLVSYLLPDRSLGTLTAKSLIINILILFITTFVLISFRLSPRNVANRIPASTLAPKQKWLQWSITLLVSITLPLINLATLLGPARIELPPTSTVVLPPPNREALLEAIRFHINGRMVACEQGLMPPYTALFYGISDLRTCSPLNNSRYLKFIESMGGKLGYCNMVEIPARINRLLDVAAVDLILSARPLNSDDPSKSADKAISSSTRKRNSFTGRIMPGLRLVDFTNKYNPESSSIDTNIILKIHKNISNRYSARIALFDEQNHELWRSSLVPLVAISGSTLLNLTNVIPVPSHKTAIISLVLKVVDTWNGTDVNADGRRLSILQNGIRLSEIQLVHVKDVHSADGRFSLLYETDDLLRLYRNNNACARAYLSYSPRFAKTAEESLSLISTPDFRAGKDVVIEGINEPDESPQAVSGLGNVQLKSSSNTHVELLYSSNMAAWLVLTDLYYPGWHCLIDGNSTEIVRANYLFRAVKVPAGEHNVRFYYSPTPFNLGLILQAITLFLLLFALFITLRTKKVQT